MDTYQLILLIALVAAAGLAVLLYRSRGPEDTPFVALARTLNVVVARGIHRLKICGDVCLPDEGPCIVVANHRSYIDPSLITGVTRRWIVFLMVREYYEAPGVHWLFKAIGCVPVNRDGNDLAATRKALKALRAGRVVGIFPQGGIRDPDAGKAGVALLALRSNAPVVPFFIDGSPVCESVLLAIFRPSRSRVFCGEPIRVKTDRREAQPGRNRPVDGRSTHRDSRAQEAGRKFRPRRASASQPGAAVLRRFW